MIKMNHLLAFCCRFTALDYRGSPISIARGDASDSNGIRVVQAVSHDITCGLDIENRYPIGSSAGSSFAQSWHCHTLDEEVPSSRDNLFSKSVESDIHYVIF